MSSGLDATAFVRRSAPAWEPSLVSNATLRNQADEARGLVGRGRGRPVRASLPQGTELASARARADVSQAGGPVPDDRETASYKLLDALRANEGRLSVRRSSIQDYPGPSLSPQLVGAHVPPVVLRDTRGLNLQIGKTHVVLLADRDDGIVYCERDGSGLMLESVEPIQLTFNDQSGEFQGIAGAGERPPTAVEDVLAFVARKLRIQLAP